MMENKAADIIRRHEQMRSYRSNFEHTWTRISELVLPRAEDFNSKKTPGTERNQKIFDSTAQLALPAFASAMESMLTPRSQKWHALVTDNKALMDDEATQRYLEGLRDLMFRVRYSPRANFASQVYEAYMSLGAFGTAGLFIEDGYANGIRYQSVPLSELYIAEDGQGVIDTVIRQYTLSARNAYRRFGDKLPEQVKKWHEKEPDRLFEFLHSVQPSSEIEYKNPGYKGMAYAACDICVEGKTLLREGGYRTMPYAVSRYVTGPREVYGRSPAWDALADIATVNEMSKTMLRWGQLATDPPWITADVDSLSAFSVRPGAVNPGYMTEQGVILAKPMSPEGNPQITLEMANQRRESINRSFLVTLFQILVDTPQMTATEAMLRAQEKGALLAPTIGRQQSEFLGTIIERELDIMRAAGAIPPMPESMASRTRGVGIEYDSPLTRAQKSEGVVGVLRTLETIKPLADIDPGILQHISPERTLRILADGNGAPIGMLRTPDEIAALQEAQAQQQQAQQAIEAAPQIAGAIKSITEAQKTAQQAPF